MDTDFIIKDPVCLFDQTGRIFAAMRIIRYSEIPAALAHQAPGTGFLIGDCSPDTHYADLSGKSGEAVAAARPKAALIDTGAGFDLSNLPEGGVLIVTDPVGFETRIPAADDVLELTDPGTYRIRSDCPWPWINFDQEVAV